MVAASTAAFTQVTDDYKKSLKTMLVAGGTEETFKVAIKQMFCPVYQKHFTKQDLDKLTEFYNTPVGKNLLKKRR